MIRFVLILAVGLLTACSTVSDITNALSSISRLQFKLGNVNNFRLAGVDVSRISDPSKLSISDGIALGHAFAKRSLVASFTLNVDAKNPNTGVSGTRQTLVTLNDLDWRMLIDDKQTISGHLGRPFDIPGSGQTVPVPLDMSLDLYSFFADKGYEGILNLALAIGGQQGSAARIKLDAMPTVGTPFGPIVYPNRIVIVDKEFRGS
ncbi:MAG: hypothetical protein SGJ05_01370 [bacterium]|nr:hypothetical protein [bacterium]